MLFPVRFQNHCKIGLCLIFDLGQVFFSKSILFKFLQPLQKWLSRHLSRFTSGFAVTEIVKLPLIPVTCCGPLPAMLVFSL